MEEHDNIVKSLNQEFKNVDKAYQTSEMRVFGQNTGQIFRELDVIRRKQINLASDHVSLEAINDIQPTQLLKQTSREHSTSKNFEKKEVILKSMMEKLDDLTQAMDRFRRISEHNYEGQDTLISVENEDTFPSQFYKHTS